MTKSFQKSARILQELRPSHPGIINPDDFNKHFELHCYEPSSDLSPFLVHIWTQRLHTAPAQKPIEVPSGPNVYLFFTPELAFIQGAGAYEFKYDPLTTGVIAGVKFRPGGFYPFLKRPVCDLESDIASVLPAADKVFRERLLSQSDEMIVTMLETLLQNIHPRGDKKLDLITKILASLDNDPSLQTVEAVAQAFDLSERSLQLLFQTYVGIGLKWIIARRRLLEAVAQAQIMPRGHLVEVAAELGYSSQSHFSRDFKRIIGQSPSQYLASNNS